MKSFVFIGILISKKLGSSVLAYQQENGRTYHAMSAGSMSSFPEARSPGHLHAFLNPLLTRRLLAEYFLPNDDVPSPPYGMVAQLAEHDSLGRGREIG
jgi:hypothetical protein